MRTRIMMVCLGNICRSPLAEGLLKSKLDPSLFIVDSAGTGSWHVGNSPDPRSVEVARKNNIDITNQRGRLFVSGFFKEYDHIYVMDSSNYDNVIAMARTPAAIAKVSMILDVLFPDEKVDIPDPYTGGNLGFESVYKMLDEATTKIAESFNK